MELEAIQREFHSFRLQVEERERQWQNRETEECISTIEGESECIHALGFAQTQIEVIHDRYHNYTIVINSFDHSMNGN